MLNVKQIVHYQVRQEKITLFNYLIMEEKIWKNKDKNTKFMSNFFFSNKRINKHERRIKHIKNSKDNERENKKNILIVLLFYIFSFIFYYLLLYFIK